MSCTYLMTSNFLDPDLISNNFVSSEQTSFPVDNIYNEQRRSKVWRSDGYFKIDSSNKTLTFRETAATPLVATLTEGEYSSLSSLFAEIKTQLETVGASTYTISQDTSTLKVKMTSDGAGGGGIFEIVWPSSTGLGSLLGFDTGSEDTGALTYTAELLRINQEEWIKWDFGISTLPKAFILIGKRNTPIPITPSSTIILQASETNAWDSPTYEQTLTYDDKAIALINTDGLYDEALRYARLKIVDKDNPLGYVEIGSLYLGDIFQSARGGVQFPFQGAYIDNSRTVFSEGGQTFSDIREKSETFGLEWNGITVADKEEIDLFFDAVGTSIPFFVSIDSNAAFSSASNYYIRYVKFVSEPSYQLVSPGNFTVSMALREEL